MRMLGKDFTRFSAESKQRMKSWNGGAPGDWATIAVEHQHGAAEGIKLPALGGGRRAFLVEQKISPRRRAENFARPQTRSIFPCCSPKIFVGRISAHAAPARLESVHTLGKK
jgi:hypothetical protein